NQITKLYQHIPAPAIIDKGVFDGMSVTKVEGGNTHSCALAEGRVFCWGSNANGRRGLPLGVPVHPLEINMSGVLSGKILTDIAAGVNNSCAIADGYAYCWGSGSDGKLGNGTNTLSYEPVEVSPLPGVLENKTV